MKLKEKIRNHELLKGNLPALFVNRIVDSTGWNMMQTIWQPFVLSLGASMSILGAFESIYSALLSILQLGTGEFSDSFGRKNLIIVSYLISILGIVIIHFSGSWLLLIPPIILFAIGDSLLEPALSPMFAESVENNKRGTAFSLLSLTWFLPGLYAHILAGFLADRYGCRLIFTILLITEIISLSIFYIFIKETIKEKKSIEVRQIISSIREVLKPRGGLGAFYALAILDRFAWSLGGGIFVGMVWETFGLSWIQIGILLNATSVATALSLLPMGRLVDRYGSRRLLIFSSAVSCLLFIGYFFSHNFQSLFIVQIIKGIAIALWDPASNTYLSNAVPDAERGKFFGNLNALKGLLSLPAPILGAFLFEVYGFQGTFLASFLFMLLAMALSFKVKQLQ